MKNSHRHHHSHRESETTKSGSTILPFISGMGLGAGIMYVLDPDRGHRRRAMAQQKLFRLGRLAEDALDKGIRDIEHRAEGLVHDVGCLVSREHIPDDILEQRVRAKLGRVACHPGSIEVRANSGEITLSGPVLRGEADDIARAVRHVRGVRKVDTRLEEHDSSESIPGLQGRSHRPGDKPELLQENWAPGTRLMMGGLGLALLLRALRDPGFLNTVAGVLGFALVARSGRRTRVLDTLMETVKPASGLRARHREDAGRNIDVNQLLRPGEIPREQWLNLFNQLDNGIAGRNVTVEVRDGGQVRAEQRDIPLSGIHADVKDRESIINVSVGRTANDLVIHSIHARRASIRDHGDIKVLEIEGNDGTTTMVSFRNADLKHGQIVA